MKDLRGWFTARRSLLPPARACETTVCARSNLGPMLSDSASAAIQAGATITGGLSLLASGCMLLLPLFAIGPRSLQYAMVRTLAAFNLVEAATFAVGRAFIPKPGAAVSAGCRAQGAIMQLSSGASFVWILFFCLVLVRSAGESTAPRVGMSRPACPC